MAGEASGEASGETSLLLGRRGISRQSQVNLLPAELEDDSKLRMSLLVMMLLFFGGGGAHCLLALSSRRGATVRIAVDIHDQVDEAHSLDLQDGGELIVGLKYL